MKPPYEFYVCFPSKKALVEWADERLERLSGPKLGWYSPGTYYLRHGEYNRPHYFPRRYKDGWGLHIEHYFFAGTFYAPADGRLEYWLEEPEEGGEDSDW